MPDPIAPTTPAPAPAPTLAESITTPVEVPVIEPAAPPTIKEVNIADIGGIKGPQELLGESPNEQLADIAKRGEEVPTTTPKRDPKTGKFAPKEEAQKPALQTPEKPVAAKPAAKKAKAETPAPAAPVQPAKVKIGDKEMTPEEIAARIAELEAKAKPPTAPETPAPNASVAEDARIAQEREADTKFIAERTKAFKPEDYGITLTPENLDMILAGGDEGVKFFADTIARVAAASELNARKFTADFANTLLRDLQPVFEQQRLIADYREEQGFLSLNPDIREHPKGAETARTKKAEITQFYNGLLQKAEAGTATPQEQAWATIYRGLSAEELFADVAHHTRAALALATPTAQPNGVVGTPPAKPEAQITVAKPAPQVVKMPFNGDRPGGHGAPVSESADARALRMLNAHQGV